MAASCTAPTPSVLRGAPSGLCPTRGRTRCPRLGTWWLLSEGVDSLESQPGWAGGSVFISVTPPSTVSGSVDGQALLGLTPRRGCAGPAGSGPEPGAGSPSPIPSSTVSVTPSPGTSCSRRSQADLTVVTEARCSGKPEPQLTLPSSGLSRPGSLARSALRWPSTSHLGGHPEASWSGTAAQLAPGLRAREGFLPTASFIRHGRSARRPGCCAGRGDGGALDGAAGTFKESGGRGAGGIAGADRREQAALPGAAGKASWRKGTWRQLVLK